MDFRMDLQLVWSTQHFTRLDCHHGLKTTLYFSYIPEEREKESSPSHPGCGNTVNEMGLNYPDDLGTWILSREILRENGNICVKNVRQGHILVNCLSKLLSALLYRDGTCMCHRGMMLE